MSDLGLPPRRELPDDVRARLRAELRQGMAKRRPARVWYAAAAAVLVLAGGAAVVARQLRQPAEVPPAAPSGLTLDGKLAKEMLDRCWAAVQAAGKAAQVPPREDWVPLFTKVLRADAVVAATAAGKPMFCETTDTTVTLSDPGAAPAYAPGTRTGLLLHSATGAVGGVLAPGGDGSFLQTETEGGSSGLTEVFSSQVTRQFVVLTQTAPAATRIAIGKSGQPSVPLPAAPPPLLAVVDRPVAADRTSPAGRALGDCLAAADFEALPDAAAYAPGPLLEADGYRVATGRHGARTVVCTTEPDYQRPGRTKSRAALDEPPPEATPAYSLMVGTLGAVEAGGERGKSRTPFAAALPATATIATVDFGAGSSVDAPVAEGLLAVWVPKGQYEPGRLVRVVARDARGAVVYDGTLALR
ncbi:hypothetical protein [Amycolatopsis tolypomycina]|uniref:hypothetical protein n=1 Tax=Amycolatopsis tolypomycina TaxID=208445 RepID=UPI0033AA5B04